MASCSAFTLANPSAEAAALSPRYCRTSADTLRPWQFAFPGVPANLGAGWMKLPALLGKLPTGMTAVVAFVAASITVTLFASVLMT
jgi:hypothetical protein